ncbi:hypothetical protein EV702DRAFT_1092123 [Suillus placidus]|uniref:Uncharacterized protein n=1 Tax=Suillus placidus TaxID=48579 RepID=A0A9P7D511_9AGAM|nr:hypothetical protein EV702DRAFT_1092123 [Suillus placidus]
MHFAALVALAVVASTVPGLAAPAPILHPQVTGAKRDDSTIFHNPPEKSRPLPARVVQDPASNTKRQWVSIFEDTGVTEGTSSNAKRQDTFANSDYGVTGDNWHSGKFDAKRQETIGIANSDWGITYDTTSSSNNAKREALSIAWPVFDYGVTEDTSSNNTKH